LNKKFNRILVSAALPYANGKIHLGHLAGAYLPADIYVRYQRSMKRDVLFVCGSDEHGVPIVLTAEQEKTTPQAIVDRYHALNKSAFEKFGMSFDNYSRTTLPLHAETAQEFFRVIHDAGILSEKKEEQLYDAKAGMFLPDRYVEGTCPVCQNPDARGDQCERCGTFLNPTELINPRSKISGATPTLRETTHWYFPLGKYQKRLEEYIKSRNGEEPWKENVLKYCQSWFKDGLTDRAYTRDLQWGVKVPLKGYENKVLYVWFEAVLGYISATKEWAQLNGKPDEWRKYWLNEGTKYVPFIGKDNIVFHCIVFPALLMAWNDASKDQYVLPENVPANEFLNFESQKFSKSRGWGIDLDEFLELFPADFLRYTLTMNLPEYRDADFTWKDFQARTNNELADIFGNFVNRTVTFVHRNYGGKVPVAGALSDLDRQLVDLLGTTGKKSGELIEQYRFRDAALEIMNLARFANKYFNDSQPWVAVKQQPEKCATAINLCVQAIRALAILTEPIMPFSAVKLWKQLNLNGSPAQAGWESSADLAVEAGHTLSGPEILFAKIEDELIARVSGEGETQDVAKTATPPKPEKSLITIDDFKKVELRVAKVIAAEKVTNSKKLLKLQVALGEERRQILAGIAETYTPESLIGKKVVVVANLQPAKLMGQESQGMMLAASNSSGLTAITVLDDIEDGSVVK